MIKELTQDYVAAFNAKDLAGVAALLHENAALEDPVVQRIEGKAAVLEAVKAIFASCARLEFRARNIFVDGTTSIIEFDLELDATRLKGADIVIWQDGLISELRAYLDIPKS